MRRRASVPQRFSTPCPMLTERFVPVGYGVSEGAVGLAASWMLATQARWSRRSQTRMRRDLSPRPGPRPRVVAAAAKGMGAAPRSAEKAPRRSAWTRHAMAAGHGRDQPRDRRGACTTSRRPRTGRTRPELRARDSADRQPSRSFWRWGPSVEAVLSAWRGLAQDDDRVADRALAGGVRWSGQQPAARDQGGGPATIEVER